MQYLARINLGGEDLAKENEGIARRKKIDLRTAELVRKELSMREPQNFSSDGTYDSFVRKFKAKTPPKRGSKRSD